MSNHDDPKKIPEEKVNTLINKEFMVYKHFYPKIYVKF